MVCEATKEASDQQVQPEKMVEQVPSVCSEVWERRDLEVAKDPLDDKVQLVFQDL